MDKSVGNAKPSADKTPRPRRNVLSVYAEKSNPSIKRPVYRPTLSELKARGKLEMVSKPEPCSDPIKDDYETAESCKNLIKSNTGICYDHNMSLHECIWDAKYPECPERYHKIIERCSKLKLLERCTRIPVLIVEDYVITKMHDTALLKNLKATSTNKNVKKLEQHASKYDAVYFNKSTFNAAVTAVSCAISLVEAVCKGTVHNGMAIIRPPGHHAMANEFCGYCFLNNVAIAAQYALDNKLASKILIVDFDVHHGQATQQMFYDNANVLYFSIHRYEHGKFWPNLRESNYDFIGEGRGKGYNINCPLNVTGLEDKDYLAIVTHILLPVAYEYQPDLIIVSAGYDASLGCLEGMMNITPGFYGQLMLLLSGLAMGKIAICLEGGYFIPSLVEGVVMTLKGLLGDPPATLKTTGAPVRSVCNTISNLKIVLRDYWNCFSLYPVYESDSEPEVHMAIAKYFGEPNEAPYLTRDCYPIASKEHIKRYETIVSNLISEYKTLNTGNMVCCGYDKNMLLHSSSDVHVENPERLKATYELLLQWGLDKRCLMLSGKSIDRAIVERVHDSTYVNYIFDKKFEKISPKTRADMYFNKNTLSSITSAVSCLIGVVDSIFSGNMTSGAALIRPPGHHANPDTAAGFCYVNNVAVAAQYILDKYNCTKVLIIDFDIHHGNGVQDIFYDTNKVLYISIHKYSNGTFYPKSRAANYDKCGSGTGEGFNVNIPINGEPLHNVDYITLFHALVLPIAYSFVPDVVLVSAGFDAGINDTLGNYSVTPDCFGHLIQMLKPLANGRIIVTLEGGYNITTVKFSFAICLKTLLGDPLPLLGLSPNKVTSTLPAIISKVIDVQKKYWPVFKAYKKLSLQSPDQDLSAMLQNLSVSPVAQSKTPVDCNQNKCDKT